MATQACTLAGVLVAFLEDTSGTDGGGAGGGGAGDGGGVDDGDELFADAAEAQLRERMRAVGTLRGGLPSMLPCAGDRAFLDQMVEAAMNDTARPSLTRDHTGAQREPPSASALRCFLLSEIARKRCASEESCAQMLAAPRRALLFLAACLWPRAGAGLSSNAITGAL